MSSTVHVIVGPERHGVCAHGQLVADALVDSVVRLGHPGAFDVSTTDGYDVVHVPYTDRLFAERCEDSAEAFVQLVEPLRKRGQAISVTLHDLPAGTSPLERRRRSAYRRVVSKVHGVVVNSDRELQLLDELKDRAKSRVRIPLPVLPAAPFEATPTTSVGVLGFIFPDRGYEHTIDELPEGVELIALGGPSVGHESLPNVLIERARAQGRVMRSTGFVPDDDLAEALARTGVPVAPNRRVAASASINTWLGHGRRPLVPDSPYTRELDRRWPGTVRRYDADEPGSLRDAIDAALANPSLTYLDADVVPGSSLDQTAAAYREHFAATAPAQLQPVGSNAWVIPGNQWNLLRNVAPAQPPLVSVVIPYFDAQPQLDRVLRALAGQTHPSDRLQIVIADDGSPQPPDVQAAGDLSVAVIRQPDKGFRAAAARNLGAEAADGEVLLFLDGDTSPDKHYVKRMARLPALAPDVLTVGRRRHLDYAVRPPQELTEPLWLSAAYKASRNLLQVDERSYRYVISAVMGMHSDLFAEIGGFDESFTSYGGEDWELAHRAYVAGAVFAHVRNAVAWHDGPDWAERADAAGKEDEEAALRRLIPDTVSRRGESGFAFPAVAIHLQGADVDRAAATVQSAANSGVDCGLWITDAAVVAAIDSPLVRPGPIPSDVATRALVLGEIVASDLQDLATLTDMAIRHGIVVTPAGQFASTRALHRSARWSGRLDSEVSASVLFGRHDLGWPTPT